MGFFKDFKRDFAQAVNELMPDKDEIDGEYDDEDMVNTFDDDDNMDIAPEDMLEDIDDFSEDNNRTERDIITDDEKDFSQSNQYEDDKDLESDYEDALSKVPEAEILSDNTVRALDDIEAEEQELIGKLEGAVSEEYEATDELKALDALDEEDMLEGTADAENLDYGNPFDHMNESITSDETADDANELQNMDVMQAVEDVLNRQGELSSEDEYETVESTQVTSEEIAQFDAIQESKEEEEIVMSEVEVSAARDEKDFTNELTADTTYITKGTKIKGSIETEGSIDVLGTVEGDVSCAGKLIIGGTIKGSVSAGEIYSNAAKVEGEVITEGSIKIGVGSVIIGNVTATSAVVAGAVNGDIDVQGPVIVDSTAVIMGNIKSRSVQINNGAVIEGFCSQCYSEIDVKSFFATEDDSIEELEESSKAEEKAAEEDDTEAEGDE